MGVLKLKAFWVIIACLVLAGGVFAFYQWNYLRVAHSTFENYYAFRGCQTLVDRTDTYGDCKLADGSTIKIVRYNDKWYLDGDLPWACITKTFCVGI
ncbi:MAG: hypothetical protein KGH79_02760 [Patescibacteria group bacterium]|nr:hypothetical protein [Patescibacteria group bacterium]